MTRARYFVVSRSGEWRISFNGQQYGPYGTQRAAIRAAVDAANRSRGDSQVLVQGLNNQFRTEWTYGFDPYPPPG